MGLFSSSEPLDRAFADVLLTKDGGALRAAAKGQQGIRRSLQQGERILAIAVDQFTFDDAVVVAGRRVLVMRRGGRSLVRAFDVVEVAGAFVDDTARDRTTLSLDGVDARIQLSQRATAEALAKLVNSLIITFRPRSIPTLNPSFYADLLARTGVPNTPTNMARMAERTAFSIGTQAAAFTAQLRDPEAFASFAARFARGGPPDRQVMLSDDMIDWLWAWNPGCHRGLVRQVGKWHDGLLQPGSFLSAAAGGEIPPWHYDPSSPPDNTDAWRMVFERNWKG